MRFHNIDEVEAVLAADDLDPLGCNICQAVLGWLKSRTKLWLVTTENSAAVVYGKHESDALMAAGFNASGNDHIPGGVNVLEINPDDPQRFYEHPDRKGVIIRKVANKDGNYDS